MTMTIVYVRTTFQGYHRWKDAPDDVAFLRDYHRHVFHVRLGVQVDHLNRHVEFFQLKRLLDTYIYARYADQKFELSCEQIGKDLVTKFNGAFCNVEEDGENGAFVWGNQDPSPTVEEKAKDKVDAFRQYVLKIDLGNPQPKMEEGVKKPPKPFDHIHDRRKTCFIGTEAEGPNKGQTVLFVPACVSVGEFNCVMEKTSTLNYGRVYYGAGNVMPSFEEHVMTLQAILRKFHPWQVDVEVGSFTNLGVAVRKEILAHKTITVVTRDLNDSPEEVTYYKMVNEARRQVSWVSSGVKWVSSGVKENPSKVYVTNFDDPNYKTDRHF